MQSATTDGQVFLIRYANTFCQSEFAWASTGSQPPNYVTWITRNMASCEAAKKKKKKMLPRKCCCGWSDITVRYQAATQCIKLGYLPGSHKPSLQLCDKDRKLTQLIPPKAASGVNAFSLESFLTCSLEKERDSGCQISSIAPKADLMQEEKIWWSHLRVCVCVCVTMCSGFQLFKLLASVLCKCVNSSVLRNKLSLPCPVHLTGQYYFCAARDAFCWTGITDFCKTCEPSNLLSTAPRWCVASSDALLWIDSVLSGNYS